MGKIFLPKWDDEAPNQPHQPHRVVERKYLGYGYWILTYPDGIKVLFKEKQNPDCFLPLSKCEQFDDNGYPMWKELVKKTLKEALAGTLIDELGILDEDDKDANP